MLGTIGDIDLILVTISLWRCMVIVIMWYTKIQSSDVSDRIIIKTVLLIIKLLSMWHHHVIINTGDNLDQWLDVDHVIA